MSSAESVIEVFADVACPFTHVGLKLLVARRVELAREDVVFRVRAWPLELVNGEPLDPAFVAEEIEELGHQLELPLFAGFDEEAFPATSIPAMALADRAYRISESVGEAMSLGLRDALFERGEDVADEAVLARIATELDVPLDLDPGPVYEDHAAGLRRGVVGSPHFFTSSGDWFCPSLTVSRDESGHLSVDVDREAFEHFASSCFG